MHIGGQDALLRADAVARPRVGHPVWFHRAHDRLHARLRSRLADRQQTLPTQRAGAYRRPARIRPPKGREEFDRERRPSTIRRPRLIGQSFLPLRLQTRT